MNTRIVTSRVGSIVLLLISVFFIASCQKENGVEEIKYEGDFGLKVNMLGIESALFGNGSDKKSSIERTSSSSGVLSAKQTVFPWGNTGLNIRATLRPDIDSSAIMNNYKKAASTRTTQEDELDLNIAYRVLAYDASGAKVADRIYKYKRYDEEEDDVNTGYNNLFVGETYTFVVYSVNTDSESDLNILESEDVLATAKVKTDGAKDLLYFERKLTLEKGVNFLDVRLKHKLSQVTTKILVDQTIYRYNEASLDGSKIYDIRNSYVSPTYSKAKLNLIDGSLDVNNQDQIQSTIDFGAVPSQGVESIESSPVRIIANGAPSKFFIEHLKVNELSNSVSLTGFKDNDGNNEEFKLEPGVRYILEFTIAAPCIADATSSQLIDIEEYWEDSFPNGKSKTFDFENDVNYGVEFDIYSLDNSFNMVINGKPLYIGSVGDANTNANAWTHNEIQFQGFGFDATARTVNGKWYPYFPNIEFQDNTRWQVGNPRFPNIWQFNGRPNKRPVIRIIVGINGVSMMASKNANGGAPFFPLRLVNDKNVDANFRREGQSPNWQTRFIKGRFNENIQWNRNGNNSVTISQTPFTRTYIHGAVRGKKFVDCTPTS